MDNQNQATTVALPSIGQLFRDAWQTFTQSILQLFLLNILGLVIYLALAVVAVLVFVLSGAGSSLLQKGLTEAVSNLVASPQALTTTIIIAVIFTVLYVIVGSALQIASILIVDGQGKTSFNPTLRKSLGLVLPIFLVGILTFMLTAGVMFLFGLPAILFTILFVFVQFEVILNNQSWTTAIKRSVMLVMKNFGPIAIRLVLIWLIYLGVFIIRSILENILPKNSAWVVSSFFFIFNLFFGWFIIAYQIILYKHARIGLEQEKGKSILWMWAIALIGWLLAAGLLFAGWKIISSGILGKATTPPQIKQNQDVITPEFNI